jgi:hypothetical protein
MKLLPLYQQNTRPSLHTRNLDISHFFGNLYSMRGRSVDHTKATIDSPGPAAYDQPAHARGNNSARVK